MASQIGRARCLRTVARVPPQSLAFPRLECDADGPSTPPFATDCQRFPQGTDAMPRKLTTTRYYAQSTFEMLEQEVSDFYVAQLPSGRIEEYEPPISEFIMRAACLHRAQPWCFLDVGANTGIYALGVTAA